MATHSSMGRGMEVFRGLGRTAHALPCGTPVSSLAESLERDRSQVSRTLAALAQARLVDRTRAGYRVAARTYARAQALSEHRLRVDGLTVLEQLSAITGEACFLGELYGASTVTIAESIPQSMGMVGSWVGRAYPAFCSDAGYAALWDADDAEIAAVLGRIDASLGGPGAVTGVAEFITRLQRARARGYSIVDEEAEAGLTSVAAPVYDYRDEVVAAVQVVGHSAPVRSRVSEFGNACRAAAEHLSAVLRGAAHASDFQQVHH